MLVDVEGGCVKRLILKVIKRVVMTCITLDDDDLESIGLVGNSDIRERVEGVYACLCAAVICFVIFWLVIFTLSLSSKLYSLLS